MCSSSNCIAIHSASHFYKKPAQFSWYLRGNKRKQTHKHTGKHCTVTNQTKLTVELQFLIGACRIEKNKSFKIFFFQKRDYRCRSVKKGFLGALLLDFWKYLIFFLLNICKILINLTSSQFFDFLK